MPHRNPDDADDVEKAMELAALGILAERIIEQHDSGRARAAIDQALGALTTEALDCWTRHRSMVAMVPHALWVCGGTAIEREWWDLAIPLQMRATQFAIIYDAAADLPEAYFPSNRMFQHAFVTCTELVKRRKPLLSKSKWRRRRMIAAGTWPFLQAPDKLYRATSDLSALMQRLDGEFGLLALALTGAACDLEPFISPQDVDGRLAAIETRFQLSTLLGQVGEYDPSRHDENLRAGIIRIIEIDKEFGPVPAEWLRPTLNALKTALFVAGHLSALGSLEMSFAGLQEMQQFTMDSSGPMMQVIMRARVELEGTVGGYGVRLQSVLDSLEENEPVRYQDLMNDEQ